MRARIDQCHNTVKAQLAVNSGKTGNAARLGDAAGFNDNMVGQGRLLHHLHKAAHQIIANGTADAAIGQ